MNCSGSSNQQFHKVGSNYISEVTWANSLYPLRPIELINFEYCGIERLECH